MKRLEMLANDNNTRRSRKEQECEIAQTITILARGTGYGNRSGQVRN